MDADVAIVGAGSAGAAAALLCARRGLAVVCLDRRRLDAAGARWINAVPGWCFDEAGLARPTPPELVAEHFAVNLVAPGGAQRVVLRGHDVLHVDMRALVRRLQRGARTAGAVLAGGVRVEAVTGDVLRTSRGPVRARWFVDAGGVDGPRLLGQPAPAADDLCSAAQQVRDVTDAAAARAFFRAHDVEPGDTLSLAGVAGGYSALDLRLHADDHMSILCGTLPALGHRPAPRLLADFVATQPWIGARRYGGARLIPLRRPYDRLAEGPVAALGDAACQVFPGHGSGVGLGLVAARLLADALADGAGPWPYAVAWQRRYGGLAAAYGLLRRFAQALPPGALGRLMAAGLLDAETVRPGLEQRLPRLAPAAVPGKLWALRGAPLLGARLVATAARLASVPPVYARYPRDPRRVAAWARVAAALTGGAVDPAA
ncbi:MAG TPA: FAD-dependent monooxygenase [Polyangia bacterium]|jgi:flavin-dependent dehydrogenase